MYEAKASGQHIVLIYLGRPPLGHIIKIYISDS